MKKITKKLLIGSLITFSACSEVVAYDDYVVLSGPVNHLTITHGFFNYTTAKQLFSNLPKSFSGKKLEEFCRPCLATNPFVLSVFHLIYQLTKIGFQYSRDITDNKSWFINVKFYSFDHGLKNLFIQNGETRFLNGVEKDKHICIIERISWFSAHGGFEYKYLTRDSYTLSWSWAAGLSLPTGYPDAIVIFTPFILRHDNGFFCRLQLVQFSILNLISSICKIRDQYKKNRAMQII